MQNFKRSRLSFVIWGLRVYNNIFFLGYPILGAFFTLLDFSFPNLGKLFLFAVLNLIFLMQVFLFNDWGDARLNPEEPSARGTHALKYPEIISPTQVLILCLMLSIISLTGIFLLSLWSGIMTLLVGLTSFIYSHPRFGAKRHFALPELAHLGFGTLYFLSGWQLFQSPNLSAVLLALFFGIILTAGNFANQIEHFEEELRAGLRTSAIIFGKRPVYHFSLVLFFLSSFYLLILALVDLVPSWLAFPASLLILSWAFALLYFRKINLIQNIGKLRRAIRIIYAGFSLALLIGLILAKI